MRPLSLLVLTALSLAFAGCSGPELTQQPGPGPFLVLEATYVLEEGEGGEFYGHHCADATIEEGAVSLNRVLEDELGDGPTLIVDPRLEGFWASLGNSGYPLRLPADLASEAAGDDGIWATIDWNGGVLVDEEPVRLPHTWTVDRDGYKIQATLALGPQEHSWFQRDTCY